MLCNPILPLEYDNSLSYMETLCKLVKKVNELDNLVNGDITLILEQYIDSKFDDLMINAVYDKKTETIILSKGV